MEENKRIEYNLVVKDNKLAVINITKGKVCDFKEIPQSSKLLELNDLPSNILKNPNLYIKDDKIKVYPDFDINFLNKIDYQCEFENIDNQILKLILDKVFYKMKNNIIKGSGIPSRYFK